ncbi:EAL domain-containing protein [Jutongia huaianensis]|uniref:EAL domain-containing protein n=1 Tax=Jutongia huaianensis TaxID=2763668 RepID=A0ABR7N1P3_9FIRM|nr:EAL domain-containing protein [Jutongia huaianensis]MBC8562540.1 EAL domain-containing protein [Jutongia huaianensis]
MDKIYMVLLVLMIIPILICIRYARKIKSDVAASIVKCLVFAIITILSNGLFVFSIDETFAYLMEALYLFSIDMVLIYILQYSQQYTMVFNEISPFRTGCFIVAYLDGISLFANTFLHNIFTLNKVSYMNYELFHIGTKSVFYHLHFVFAFCLVFCIIASFITKITRIPYFYRKKYFPILVVICVILVLNVVCDLSEFPVDLSLPFFVFAAILICYLSLYRSPKELVDKTLSIVVTEMNNMVICFDINNECVYANDRALEMFRISEGSLQAVSEYAKAWLAENDIENRDSLEWSDQKIIDNKIHYFDIEYRKLFDQKKEYIGFFLNLVDNTEKHLALEQERYLATHDTLTGLYNKSHFAVKSAEILKSHPDEEWLLLSSNIKDFKLINDLFGMEKGNEVLKMEAGLLKERCRDGIVYGRIGGDKFAICMPKARFQEEYFTDAIQTMGQVFNNDLYHLHIYIGVYEITDINEDISIMCDKANFAIKTLNENYARSIAYYNDTILNNTILEKQLVGDFDQALKEKQFCMYLQPQMTSEGKMLGAEALVRWQHPKRGLIFPGDFIEVFEKTGLIYRLDRFIWELAVQKLARWQQEGHSDLYISVNISTKDFYYMNVYETITALVEKYRIIPSTLKLEITETAIMTGTAGELDMIEQFREYGFQVEIDDFGSGYSSFNTLKDMDVDVLKIDMGFLRTSKPENLEKSMSILNMIISLSKTLGLSVVTEGVETKEQVVKLTQMGCRIYQGYYFSKPIPVEEFEKRYM